MLVETCCICLALAGWVSWSALGKNESAVPVSSAKNGFTPQQAAGAHSRYSFAEGLRAGDVSLFEFLNLSEMLPAAVVARAGQTVALAIAPDATIGSVQVRGDLGDMSLDSYLVHPASRAQGLLVLHKGQIVFEQYPGMREFDSHVWMSIAKTLVGLVIALEAADGLIDVNASIDAYVPEFAGTAWHGIKVIDLLDMASGLDLEENEENRHNPRSPITRMLLAECGENNADGTLERMKDVMRQATKIRDPGRVFEYSSMNTQALVLLSEEVEKRRWADIARDRVWRKMYAEGDLLVNVTPDGIAMAHGFVSGRLRDLGRYGLLYTPSWNRASSERVVTENHLRQIQAGARIHIDREASFQKMAAEFAGDRPVSKSWHWDAIFADGDLCKTGVRGQGLYVSPGKDLVICWFSTVLHSDLPAYARTIARFYADH